MNQSLLRIACALALLPALVLAAPARATAEVEVMPGIGVGHPTTSGDDAFDDAFDPGPGLSLSLGARLHPMFSLDLGLGYDQPGMDSPTPLLSLSAHLLRAQIVPAFRLTSGKLDFSLGPSLGLFYLRVSGESRAPIANDDEGHLGLRGFTLGVRAALMIRVASALSLGPLVSFQKLSVTRACASMDGDSVCDDDPDDLVDGYWNIGVALLF
jgi:hypothetical protein